MSGDVDAIIPAYKASDTIARALASVAAQTLKPKRAIVVVDGSDDGTQEAAEACRKNMNGIGLIVIRQENKGAGAARNRAIEEATATYIAFLDADDEWLPEKLAQTMPHFTTADMVLVSHNVIVDDQGSETRVECFARFRDSGKHFSGLYRRGYISTSTAVARRSAVLAVGGFDTALANAQDFDLWLALTRSGAGFEVFDGWLTRNHLTEGSITSHTDRRLKCCITIAERYGRSGVSPVDLWFRLAAVHGEALSAHLARGHTIKAVMVCLRLPVFLIISTLKVLLSAPQTEQQAPMDQIKPAKQPREIIAPMLWLWIAVVCVAYSWQFIGLINPLLKILGI